ncbi:MAG: lipid A export permease/ATP-binding protein MsbA [Pseudomonadales bacterium]
MSKSGKPSDWRLYQRLLKYVVPLWAPFLVSIVGYLIYSGSQVLVADWSQFVFDTLAGEEKVDSGIVSKFALQFFDEAYTRESYRHALIAIAIMIISALRGVGYFLGSYYMGKVAAHVVCSLRQDVFQHMLSVPAARYDQSSTGDLTAKLVYHVDQVTGAATHALTIVFREGFFVLGLFAYMLFSNWKLTLIIVLVFPILGLLISMVSKQFRRISLRLQNTIGGVTQVANEVIGGYKEVRLFGGAKYESERFAERNNENRRQTIKMAWYNGISTPAVQMVTWSALAIMVWVALRLSHQYETPGQFVAYLGAATLIARPVRQLTSVISTIQRGMAACEDLFGFMDTDVEVDQGKHVVDRVEGRIEFDNVSFAYTPDGEDVLNDINFSIDPGQTVALVGLSGSGKSTLVSLLARFYNHDRGKILLDGVDVNEFQLDNLRSHIAIVTQKVTLFDDTVYNNVAYGALADSKPEDVRWALEAAQALDFVTRLPLGLETKLGEDGVLLSGGQRQRIAIARALLKDAPVLILDEATSALDNKAENQIQKAMEAVMANRTTLVVAHRLSTIENADIILVMEEGHIIERGSHQQLMDLNQRYSSLYQRRFTEES